jgi:asparagine synthase (glutamine-hydrolysing)
MCGIFAIMNPPERKIDLHSCRVAVDLQKHRGPDASGEWISEPREVYLGHRRLSIIDPSTAGSQPMIGNAGNVLIYNGEIYNFNSIRKELESLGCRFKSSSDTEVLLQALDTWGEDCLEKLEGMFAFVYWRPALEEALIVRDFFGIKPLYFWTLSGGGLAVSSEIKSFYALPEFSARLNSEALPEFLEFRSLCGEQTLLQNVKQVEPGQFLRYQRTMDRLDRITYWNSASAFSSTDGLLQGKAARDEFLGIFRGTVKRHMIADVPVGTQFSGGVDSSLITALAIKDLKTDLTGFHCRVDSADFDEMPLAVDIGRLLGLDVKSTTLSSDIFFSELLERLTWHHDEPLTHPNSVGIFLISEIARDKVKVLLSGEAADEFFGGYSRYPLLLIQNGLQHRPVLHKGLIYLSRAFPYVKGRARSFVNFLQKTGHMSLEDQIVAGGGLLEESVLQRMLGDPEAFRKSIRKRSHILQGFGFFDILTRCQLFDISTYLPPLFVRQDKMSMAASIENRVPFATPRILSTALRLPPKSRATTFGRKRFLKSCLYQYVPKKYANRRKWGFGIPLGTWLSRPEGTARLRSMIARDSSLRGVVDMKTIGDVVTRFNGDGENANILWTLLSLKVWMDVFYKEKPTVVTNRGAFS